MTVLDSLAEFPPRLVFAAAKRRRRPDDKAKGKFVWIRLREMSELTGIGIGRLRILRRMLSWGFASVSEASAILSAAGYDHARPWVFRRYLRRTVAKEWPMGHLTGLTTSERRALGL